MEATILLVEDNPITRKMVRYALEQKSIGVREAPDGRSALKAVEGWRPDLVLQDLVLPDMDGFELATQLRALLENPRVPILAFSGLLSKLEEARISRVGFDDHLVKPVEPSRLIQVIRAHLPQPEQSKDRFGQGRRLLVADDDPAQAKLAALRLGRFGFATEVVHDGVAALARLKENPPDVVLADVMMPQMDGFGLCLAVRRAPALRHIPIILVTSSYIDDADRQLAERAGANVYISRSPDFREVVEYLREFLVRPATSEPKVAQDPVEVEREHNRRVFLQLERQVALNSGMAQRCAILSAELAILSGISNALARQEDVSSALDETLATTFDAGGISIGALCLFSPNEPTQVRSFGVESWASGRLVDFFGDLEEARQLLAAGQVVPLPADGVLPNTTRALKEAKVQSALLVPLVHRNQPLGALLLASRTTTLTDEDRIDFASGVASQITHAVALTQAFEEKQASELAARNTAATLQAMMNCIADGVAVADEEGHFLFWNRAAESILGLKATTTARVGEENALPGLFLPDKFTPFPPQEHPLARAVYGESVDRVEMFARHEGLPKGAWLSVSSRPLMDAGGEHRGGVAVFRDVTAERVAQEQLMVSDRMASVGMLAAGVAHEINNPLAAVHANLSYAVKEMADLSPEVKGSPVLVGVGEALEDAREGSKRVREIIRDLKIFSRAQEERHEAIDIEKVLDSSVRMAWNEIRHRARLVKDYGSVPTVGGHESRLGQVFLNLLVNATQAIPEGRADSNTIRVVTRRHESGRVLVELNDTGPGIPPEVLKKLFTPFFTTKPAGVGTGLGLAICQRIVSALGGEIQVSSEIGRGTSFQVFLPILEENEVKRPSTQPDSVAPFRGRVLVVDDDAFVGVAVKRILAQEHEVVVYNSARDALGVISTGTRFDVILCDLMMPTMSGMEFFEELAKCAPGQEQRMIFLTGGAFTVVGREFLDKIPNARLEKPFEVEQLRHMVNRKLEKLGR
jgi:PAS domain S-box-containing protein